MSRLVVVALSLAVLIALSGCSEPPDGSEWTRSASCTCQGCPLRKGRAQSSTSGADSCALIGKTRWGRQTYPHDNCFRCGSDRRWETVWPGWCWLARRKGPGSDGHEPGGASCTAPSATPPSQPAKPTTPAPTATPSPTGRSPSPAASWTVPLSYSTFFIGFNIVNPSAPGWGSCFNRAMNKLVHAGEDRGTKKGTAVKAVGDGRVVLAAYVSYPGSVVVIRHDLDASESRAVGAGTNVIYSMYGHVTGLKVSRGDDVKRGEVIASVLNQGKNSHLHWEMRTAKKPPLCGSTVQGPGYTAPGTDATRYGYLDPSRTIAQLAAAR